MIYKNVLCLLFGMLMYSTVIAVHPNANLNTSELIEKYGYFWESHAIQTEDGYFLEVYRIPGSPKNPPRPGKPVVFLQHGFLSSSDDFVAFGKEQSLACILSDKNYDVWIGNTRGNKYSNTHVSLEIDDNDFWRFSWHESGIYDLPATIDYILKRTSSEKLFYVGHSQGTTIFLAMLSEKPEYNDKISKAVLLAPVANMTHTKSKCLKTLGRNIPAFGIMACGIFMPAKASQMLSHDGILAKSARCSLDYPIMSIMSEQVMVDVLGSDDTLFAGENKSNFLGHFPAGASLRQLEHFISIHRAKRFQKFDYGPQQNMKLYNAPIPDLYNLDNVKVPLAIFYSKKDRVGDYEDVEDLIPQLNSCEYSLPIEENFNHAAFVYSAKAPSIIYSHITKYFT